MEAQREWDPTVSESDGPSIDIDADRRLEEDTDDLAPPLDAPFETPVVDLIDQRRSVPIDETDDR